MNATWDQTKSSVRLYYSPGACSLAPHILLEEIDIPFETEVVFVSEGRTQSTEHLARNPKGRIPVLDVAGHCYTEVPAISYWIAGQRPNLKLIPDEIERIVRVLEWFNWLSSTVHAVAFGQIWRPQRFVRDNVLFAHVIAKGRENAVDAFAFIEKQLVHKSWVVPDAFTVIDPYLLVFYRWGFRIDLDMRRAYPWWTALVERLAERPAVQRALSREGIKIWPT